MGCAFIKPVMVITKSSVNDCTELLQNMQIAFNLVRHSKQTNSISTKTSKHSGYSNI